MAATPEQIASLKAEMEAAKAKYDSYVAQNKPKALIDALYTRWQMAVQNYNAVNPKRLGVASAPAGTVSANISAQRQAEAAAAAAQAAMPAATTYMPTAMTRPPEPEESKFPIVPVAIAGGVAVLALVGFFVWRSRH